MPKEALLWVNSGAWNPNEESILVADNLNKNIVSISAQGSTSKVGNLIETRGEFPMLTLFQPSRIRTSSNRYLVEDEEAGEIFVLDEEHMLSGMIQAKDRSIGAEELVEIYDWAPLGKGILAFGDLQHQVTKQWESAFVYFDHERQQVLYRVPLEASSRAYYQRNLLSYIATHDDIGYIVLLEDRPRLMEFRLHVGSLRELPFFPEDFRKLKSIGRIPGFYGSTEATSFYNFFQRSKLVAGIFAWAENIYLLAKEGQRSDGYTDWWLIELNPGNGQETTRIHLPTGAAHLTVVPGHFWALIEKGIVAEEGTTGSPYMPIEAMTLMPAAWLENGPQAGSVKCSPL